MIFSGSVMSKWSVLSHLSGKHSPELFLGPPAFPRPDSKPRVYHHRVLTGIILINRNGLSGRDVLAEFGPVKTIYYRWKRWGNIGVFARTMRGLPEAGADPSTLMIDATHMKSQRTASSLWLKKGGV